MSIDADKCERVFRLWVDSTVSSWLNEFEAWDMMIEDGYLSEEELSYIQKNMSLGEIEVVNRDISDDTKGTTYK